MLKNKEFKKFMLGEAVILFLTIGFILICNSVFFVTYKNNLTENNARMIDSILSSHPELEDEIVASILSNDGKTKNGFAILEKYGLTEIDNLDYIASVQDLKGKMLVYLLLFASFTFVLLSSLYFWFIKRQYKRIREINAYMLRILNGDYSFDIKDYEEGDISNLKNDVYKITTLLRRERELAVIGKKELETVLSDISHQLKTPLTSMYVMNDLLYDDTMDPAVRKDFLNKNKMQLERIEWLVTSLLKISRLDSGTIVLKKEKVSLEKLIGKAKDPIEIPLELKEQEIKVEGDTGVCAEVDLNWTAEALLNIFKNAHEHSPSHSTIHVTYGENALYQFIIIKDEGEGIEEKDLRHIFKRFYKGNVTKESIGIGLNMAYTIITKQKGTITVESTKGEGTTFTIQFYKNTF